MSTTYTATLYFQNHPLSNRSSNDLNLLTVSLLNQLQEISSGAVGIIMDQQGRIVRRCKKMVHPKIGAAEIRP